MLWFPDKAPEAALFDCKAILIFRLVKASTPYFSSLKLLLLLLFL